MNCPKHSYTYSCNDADPCPYCELNILREALDRIANTPDDYEMEYCRQIAISALEAAI